MKIAKIEKGGRFATAVVEGDVAHVISGWLNGSSDAVPFDAPTLAVDEIARRRQQSTEALPLSDIALAPPTGPLSKLICLGFNYLTHIEETHANLPTTPSLFTKFSETLVGNGAPVVKPRLSDHYDYEGEITVVIGKTARHLTAENALEHVFGYTIMLDGSVRDYQKKLPLAGKNFWRSGAIGPWIVTADEIQDPKLLSLETRLNGDIVQATTADLMVYDIPSVLAYITSWAVLNPGDIIATGTPAGVGSRRTPPLWMKHGDLIEVEVPAIGVLSNYVENEA